MFNILLQLVCKKALDKHPSLKSLADLIGNGLITLNGEFIFNLVFFLKESFYNIVCSLIETF